MHRLSSVNMQDVYGDNEYPSQLRHVHLQTGFARILQY